jgi:magnesium transporter
MGKETSQLVRNFEGFFKEGHWEKVSQIPAVELAHLLPDLSLEEQDHLLENQSLERVAAILSEADEAITKPLLERWTASSVADVVGSLNPDDGVDLLASLSDQESREVLKLVENNRAREVQSLLDYDPESAGGLMTPDCIRLPESFTVEEALTAVRDGLDAEMVNYIYVLDSQEHLRGIVSMRDLLNADSRSTLDKVMVKEFVSVQLNDDKEDVVETARKYDFLALPVLDNQGYFKGIITVDDILDVLDEEASEDMYRMAGTGAGTPTLEPVIVRVGKRLPYLGVTLFGGACAAVVFKQFSQHLNQLATLSYFVPMVIGMAGNVGVQSSTVVVRGLATGSIVPQRFWKVFKHEICVGGVLALFFCLFSTLIVFYCHDFFGVEADFAWYVGAGMASSISLAAVVGTSVPLLCEKFGIDPALAAGPFVTTTNDVIGVFVYLQIAKFLYDFMGRA